MGSIFHVLLVLITYFNTHCMAASAILDEKGNIISGYSSAVHERGWVSETIDDHKMITKNNNITAFLDQRRNFKNRIVLTFVTPWNTKGYKWSTLYAKKFTHISPVWYDIQPIPGSSIGSYMLLGESNVDIEWIKSIRLKNEKINIYPRYTLKSEHWSIDLIEKFFKIKKSQKEFMNILSKSLRNKVNGYNGCVLEITPFFNYLAHIERQYNDKQITRKDSSKIKKRFRKFIENLSKRLRKTKKSVYLVMSPYHINIVNLNSILKYVRGIILMTYDFSVNQGKIGGNAPMNWLKNIVENVNNKIKNRYEFKILMGLNFYGYKYNNSKTDAIIGDELIELLKKKGDNYKWKWDSEIMEHYLGNINDDGIKIYYPTLMSIATRVEFASMYKIGLSIWELGQGMEYFTDLL